MLRMIHTLRDYKLSAKDDEFGKVKDFLFDEEHWTVRFMVADTGGWLTGRKVLISPASLKTAEWGTMRFAVNLTREEIENAPPLASDAPVSRQYETQWSDQFGYPYYWGTSYAWGSGMTPWSLAEARAVSNVPPEPGPEDKNRVLRSVEEVRNYHVQARDGAIGHIEDFILDDETWSLRYLVVDTRNWLPGRKVLVAPEWTDSIEFMEQHITTPLSRDAIKASPEFDPREPINREYEKMLYDYYGRPLYREN